MAVKGASFLMERCGTIETFIPENLTQEQVELANLAIQFMEKEIVPLTDRIESQEPYLMPNLIKKAGEVGLLMAEIPEKFGGLGMNKVSSTVLAENASHEGSFVVALMCHTGIGTLPILYFGSDAQKTSYLPKLASGELLGAYALTEPGSGSDALAAQTKAILSKDKKSYILNGEKLYITNGGFSDLFTVFAKVDGKEFTAFLVEKGSKGLSTGPEEKKMGIRGSSTVPVILNDVSVPVQNVLGEVGKGHKIAFNILNVGRWKLGAACLGSSKRLLEIVVPYAKERFQFGFPIASFEMIKEKVANMAIQIFLLESIVYRYAGMLDDEASKLNKEAEDYYTHYVNIVEEYQIEASIAKVFGSEVLQYVADESVQILGGYGFIQDYKVERFYRDCRVNRIFEGTNEINRLIIPGTIFKRAISGKLDMMSEIQGILGELKSGFPTIESKEPLAVWRDQLIQLKKLVIYVGGVAVQSFGPLIQQQQLVLKGMADLTIEAFAMDSAMARVLALIENTAGKTDIPIAMIESYMAEKLPQLKAMARQILVNIGSDDEKKLASYLKAVERFLPFVSYNVKRSKIMIVERVIDQKKYAL